MTIHPQTAEGFFFKIKADSKYYPARFKSALFLPVHVMFLLLLTPGFQLALCIRLQELLAKIPLIGKLLRRIQWYWTTIYFGSDIDPACTIGSGVYFPHPYGIVIGGGCIIGKNVSINQNVTLGRRDHDETGDPVIQDGVAINAGAVIVGSVTIGKNAKIGANAVVLKDIPENTTAVGIPAHCL